MSNWHWAAGIDVYVPYEFSELVSNKLEAYEVAKSYDPRLHPRTADYYGTAAQVESFLDRSRTAFIKPRAGNKGNQIFDIGRPGAPQQVLHAGTFKLEHTDRVTLCDHLIGRFVIER